jgi:hypothetical protein
MNIARIKDEDNLFRDLNSNAVIVRGSDDGLERKRQFFNKQTEDINNLKKEVSELRETTKKILEILTEGKNK